MKYLRFLPILCLAACVATAQAADKVRVSVQIDRKQVLDINEWSQKAKKLVVEWYPKIQKILGATNKDPRVTLAFERFDGIAGTAGNRIAFNVGWIEKHPDDFGMVIHELVHVVQAYPKYDPSWLIEGLADYIRYFVYEPEKKAVRVDPKRANYRNGYGDAAAFVNFVEQRHPGFVKQAHKVLREGAYRDGLWVEWTGKTLDENWKEFLASLPTDKP